MKTQLARRPSSAIGAAKTPSGFGRRRRFASVTTATAGVAQDGTASQLPWTHPTQALKDLAARRPVWEALASLFLDTDAAHSRASRVAQLAQSRYSVEELEWILIYEVYPVCTYNMLSVAGAWAGFNAQWLEALIIERLRSRWRFLRGLNLGRILVPYFGQWRRTKREISAARGVPHG